MTAPEAPKTPALCIDVVTLFPEAVGSFLEAGLVGKAIDRGLVEVHCVNPRDFTQDAHRTVDDAPFGGGPGMVMTMAPVVAALESIEASRGRGHRVVLSPSGRRFDQQTARELAGRDHLVLLCGRYEGIDDRVREHYAEDCISIGDFVLNGGEVAALAVIEAVARLVEGVVSNPASIALESFAASTDVAMSDGVTLEHPQYTRPADFRGARVPEVLSSGDHPRIERWRAAVSRLRTLRSRPDLARGNGASRAVAAKELQMRISVALDLRGVSGPAVRDAALASLAGLPLSLRCLVGSPGGSPAITDETTITIDPHGTPMGKLRRRLRGSSRARIVPLELLVGPADRLPGVDNCVLSGMEELREVLLVHSAKIAQGSDVREMREFHVIFVLGPGARELADLLRGGDPPLDFVIAAPGDTPGEKTSTSGLAIGGQVIDPAHPQPPQAAGTSLVQATQQLRRILEDGA